jgi:D-methionine transport system ATP-binding protein
MNASPAIGDAETIVRLDEATKVFKTHRGEVKAVDRVTLDIRRGEVFGVIGYSGAGKSTVVRLINALEAVDSGHVIVQGRDLAGLGERELRSIRADIGMIFQQFNLFGAKTVAANVGYPLMLAGMGRAERAARVAEMLEFVGIADKAKAYPAQLSGGQKQRVGIARALAASPAIILADEATSALDPETTREVLDLLRQANRELGLTIVLITHEMSVVQYLCDRVAVMDSGRVIEAGDVYSVFARPRHPVTRRFVATALHDRPRRDTVDRLHQRHPGRLAIVSVEDQGTGGFDPAGALAGIDVRAGIVFGGITEVDARPFGSVVVELTGSPAATSQALDRLRTLGSQVTDLGTAANPHPDPDWQVTS